MEDKQNQNFLLAVVLSMIVVGGWSYFIALPRAHQEQLRREMEAKQATTQSQSVAVQPAAGSAPPATDTTTGVGSAAAPAGFASRAAALAATPRLAIDSPGLYGSIALQGGRFDDVVLKKYHDTVDPTSANTILLSPQGFAGGYHADFDWQDADGKPVVGPQTLWQAPVGATLTAATPVTLTADLGNGLSIKRTVSIDSPGPIPMVWRLASDTRTTRSVRPSRT